MGVDLIWVNRHVNRDLAFLLSIIWKTHDISHPIGSMQILQENTKTLQELQDPSFRMLEMQYIHAVLWKREGSGFKTMTVHGVPIKGDSLFQDYPYWGVPL